MARRAYTKVRMPVTDAVMERGESDWTKDIWSNGRTLLYLAGR